MVRLQLALLACCALARTPSAAEDVDVVVVGAGMSGLWTAHELRQRTNLSVVVLEGNSRVGGRVLSHNPGTADSFDFGAHWVGSSQYHIISVLKLLGKETYQQFTKGTKVLDIGGRIRHYNTPIPQLPLFQELNFAIFALLATLDIHQVSREAPYNWSKAQHYDGMTVESFCDAFPWSRDTRELVAAASPAIFGKDMAEVSALQYLHYSACVGGIMPLLDATPGGGQELKVHGGTQAIAMDLAKQADVRFNATVVSIDMASGTTATVRTLDGREFNARRVVMTAPPHLAVGIWYNPPLPPSKSHLLAHMMQGHLIKVLVTYDQPFWRTKGFSGELVSSGFPLSICYDDTTPGNTAAIVCFVGGESAVKLTDATVDVRRQTVVQALSRYFGPEALNFKEYLEKDWGLEPFTGGCPAGSMNAGAITRWGPALRQRHGLVHFGGTETATWWYGFMNGAIQSGERCAIEVMEAFDLPVPQDMRDFENMGGAAKHTGGAKDANMIVA